MSQNVSLSAIIITFSREEIKCFTINIILSPDLIMVEHKNANLQILLRLILIWLSEISVIRVLLNIMKMPMT